MSKTLPVLAMRNGVLFPGVTLPITAGRAQTLRAIEAAMRDPEHRVLVLAQKTDEEDVKPEGLYGVGTIATISNIQRGPNGVRLVLEGVERAAAVRVVPHEGYLLATVAPQTDQLPLEA